MNFTEIEKNKLVDHTKSILKYFENEIIPYVKDVIRVHFKTIDSEPNMVIRITSEGTIQMYRSNIGSTVYSLGSPYDPNYISKNAINIFECYDEMFYLIRNWKTIKRELESKIENTKNKDIIYQFSI